VSVVAEEIVTVLAYEADMKPVVAADKAVDALTKQNEQAAVSADKLTDKIERLADRMQETADHTLALKERQLQLKRQIDATGKATPEQTKELHRLKMEIEDNEMLSKRLAASQKELQRELKKTREETKRLADEERKAARAKQQQERDAAKQEREVSRQAQAQAKHDAAFRKKLGMEEETLDKRSLRSVVKGKEAPSLARGGGDEKTGIKGVVADKLGLGGLSGMTTGAVAVAGAAAGVAALAAGMALLGSKVYETSKQFQSLRASLITVTGSSAAADTQFQAIKDFAAQTPYQVEQATSAFIKLKALGLDASQAALKSYGNTASALGKDLNDMIEAVADATTGEFERLKEFGIKSSSAGDKVTFTFRGVKTTVKKEAEAIENYLKGIGDVQFAGAMERQMQTIGGLVSNLEDTWSGFLMKIGQGGQMSGLEETIGRLGRLMSDDLAKSLGSLQKEGTGILNDMLSQVSASDLDGLVQGLVVSVKSLRAALQPVLAILGATIDGLAALGRILDHIDARLPSINRLWINFKDIVSGAFDTVKEKTSGITDALDSVWEAVDRNESATEKLGEAWEYVATALDDVTASADKAKGSLLSLISKEFSEQVQALGNELETKGQRFVQNATQEQLQRMRAGGGKLGAVADAELVRRADEGKAEREESLYQLGGGEKFKTKTDAATAKAIDDVADEEADKAYRSARDSGASAEQARRIATVRKGEEVERLTAAYDATGVKPKKKGGKGKGAKYEGLEKIARAQIDELATQAGEREAARLTVRISEGKESMSVEDALAAGQTKRKEVRDKLLSDFYSSGRLPPGIRSDLQRLTEIPSVEQQIGKVAPPVIAVNNYKVDASIGTLNVAERGTFSGTARENAQALRIEIDQVLSMRIREAMVDITQGELQ
jgi:hypothetical protein